MPLTQAEAITLTRDALNEATARQWSDTQLRRWINAAVRDIARVAEIYETTATFLLTAAVQTYDLSVISPAITRIHRVEFVPTGSTQVYPLEYEDYSNLDHIWGTGKTTSQARPSVWTAWGFSPAINFLVYPTPSIGGDCTLYYYAIPDKLDEDTTADANAELALPEGWDDVITVFAEYHALRRDRDQRWQEAKQLYDERLNHLMNVSNRHSDQAGRLVPTGNGSVPGWLVGSDWGA